TPPPHRARCARIRPSAPGDRTEGCRARLLRAPVRTLACLSPPDVSAHGRRGPRSRSVRAHVLADMSEVLRARGGAAVLMVMFWSAAFTQARADGVETLVMPGKVAAAHAKYE